MKVGNGPRLIAIDAHIDTVDVGNAGEWKHDPFKGKVEGGLGVGPRRRRPKRGRACDGVCHENH